MTQRDESDIADRIATLEALRRASAQLRRQQRRVDDIARAAIGQGASVRQVAACLKMTPATTWRRYRS